MLTLIMIFVISGCGNKATSNNSEGLGGINSAYAGGSNNSSNTNSEPTNNKSDYDAMLDDGVPPLTVGLTKFMEVKGESYEMLEPVIDNISQTNPFASFAFFPLITTDLTILPLTMLGALPKKSATLWEGNLMFLMDGTGRVEVSGNVSSFSMEVIATDNPDNSMTIVGEYDYKKDTLKAVFEVADGSQMIFEYTAVGDGYVSQLYTESTDGNTLIRSAFNSQKLYAGILEVRGLPESIYGKNITDWEAYVQSDDLMVILDNGKGYTILEGEKFDF